MAHCFGAHLDDLAVAGCGRARHFGSPFAVRRHEQEGATLKVLACYSGRKRRWATAHEDSGASREADLGREQQTRWRGAAEAGGELVVKERRAARWREGRLLFLLRSGLRNNGRDGRGAGVIASLSTCRCCCCLQPHGRRH